MNEQKQKDIKQIDMNLSYGTEPWLLGALHFFIANKIVY